MDERENTFPLKLAFCHDCSLVQLVEMPPSEEVWNPGYSYLTGTTPEAEEYFDILAYTLVRKLKLKKGSLVVDIGSNDGTFLAHMKAQGMNVLGIDPSRLAVREARDRSVVTIENRLENLDAGELREKYGKPDLITAFNVLAHTDRPHDFLERIRELDASFLTQNHYLPRMIEWTEYDTIYHEHARYYTLHSLRRLLENHGLGVQDMDEVEYYGGSFLLRVTSGGSSPYLWKDYVEADYKNYATYDAFAERVKRHSEKLVRVLDDLKSKGKKIAGAGAPMKCSTLLNFAGIDTRYLSYVIERNQAKHGLYIPGVRVPITSYDTIKHDAPDYVLILAWNAARSIIQIVRGLGYNGKFIVPIPEPRIL